MKNINVIDRSAFYSITEFPKLQQLCNQWEVVRDEFLQLGAPMMQTHREGEKKHYAEVIQDIKEEVEISGVYGWIRGWGAEGGNNNWIQYGLMSSDEYVNEMVRPFVEYVVPNTYQLIAKIQGIKICAFVTLKAQTILHCHTHPEIFDEGLLQLHLPLVTAVNRNYAYLNVNGEFRQHICGKPIIFDGSLDHFAINESNEDRSILYIEFKRDD